MPSDFSVTHRAAVRSALQRGGSKATRQRGVFAAFDRETWGGCTNGNNPSGGHTTHVLNIARNRAGPSRSGGNELLRHRRRQTPNSPRLSTAGSKNSRPFTSVTAPGIYVNGVQPRPPCLACSGGSQRGPSPPLSRPCDASVAAGRQAVDGGGGVRSIHARGAAVLFGSFAQSLRCRQSDAMDNVNFARERASEQVQLFCRSIWNRRFRPGGTTRNCRTVPRQEHRAYVDRRVSNDGVGHTLSRNDSDEAAAAEGLVTEMKNPSTTTAVMCELPLDTPFFEVQRRLATACWADVLDGAMGAVLGARPRECGRLVAVTLVENVVTTASENILRQSTRAANSGTAMHATNRGGTLGCGEAPQDDVDECVRAVAKELVRGLIEAWDSSAVPRSHAQPAPVPVEESRNEGVGNQACSGELKRGELHGSQSSLVGHRRPTVGTAADRVYDAADEGAIVTAVTDGVEPGLFPTSPRPDSWEVINVERSGTGSPVPSDLQETCPTYCSSAILSLRDGEREEERNQLPSRPNPILAVDGWCRTCSTARGADVLDKRAFDDSSRKRHRNGTFVRITNVPISPVRRPNAPPFDPANRMVVRAKPHYIRQATGQRPHTGIQAGVIGADTRAAEATGRAGKAGAVKRPGVIKPRTPWSSAQVDHGRAGGGLIEGDLESLLSDYIKGDGGDGRRVGKPCDKGSELTFPLTTMSDWSPWEEDFVPSGGLHDSSSVDARVGVRTNRRRATRAVPPSTRSHPRPRSISPSQKQPPSPSNGKTRGRPWLGASTQRSLGRQPESRGQAGPGRGGGAAGRGDSSEIARMIYGVAIGGGGDLSSVKSEKTPLVDYQSEYVFQAEDGRRSTGAEERTATGSGLWRGGDGRGGGGNSAETSSDSLSGVRGVIGTDVDMPANMWQWVPPTPPKGTKTRSVNSPREILYRVLAADQRSMDNQVEHADGRYHAQRT